ncbi:MAG TPA: hypothetical protein VG986_00100 [Pseudolabrys sp.]|nr:hypothetical protein [Pseudolabrys sp.]
MALTGNRLGETNHFGAKAYRTASTGPVKENSKTSCLDALGSADNTSSLGLRQFAGDDVRRDPMFFAAALFDSKPRIITLYNGI